MIGYLHTQDFGDFVIGFDHVPFIGMKLRLPNDQGIYDERDGWYLVHDVVMGVPDSRLDIYATRITEPVNLSYSSVNEAAYQDKLGALR
jgi:hypothetical protein